MGKIISCVNRKGGVGKTTLTIALADYLTAREHRSVVVVDMDPQASASGALLGHDVALRLSREGKTLANSLEGVSGSRDIIPNLLGYVGMISGTAETPFALIPNGDEFWDYEANLLSDPAQNGAQLLQERVIILLDHLKRQYDFVLIDCPPGRLASTDTALALADLVLCPVVPDQLSQWGLDRMEAILARIRLDHVRANPAQQARFVFNRYRANVRAQKTAFDAILGREKHVQPGRIPFLLAHDGMDVIPPKRITLGDSVSFLQRIGLQKSVSLDRIYRLATKDVVKFGKAVTKVLES